MNRREAKEILDTICKLEEWIAGNEEVGDEHHAAHAALQREDAVELKRKLSEGGYSITDLMRVERSRQGATTLCPLCGSDLARETPRCKLCYREICPGCDIATAETGPVCLECDRKADSQPES